MSLSNVLSKKPAAEMSEQYFTCLIEESFVTMAIWVVVDQKPKVLTIGTPKEWLDLETLVDAVELGLEEFHEQADGIGKVLFSLPEEWVSEADIKPDYKEVLRKLTQKLALHPLGYVVTVEAIFQYFFQYKASAVRSLYLQILGNEYHLFVTEHGRLKQKEVIGRSDQFVEDMIEGLSRLTIHPLPAQLYLFSFEIPIEQLEQDKQAFLAYDWDSTKLFHHLPSIDVLSRSEIIQAACLSGGSETLGHSEAPESIPSAVPEKQEENFGFEEVVPEAVEKKQEGPVMTSFGIPIPQSAIKTVEPPPKKDDEPAYAIDQEDEEPTPRKPITIPALPSFAGILSPVTNLFKRPAKDESEIEIENHRPAPRKKKRVMALGVVVVGGLLAVLGSGVYGWVVLQRTAEIEILLKTKPVTTDTQIKLDPDIEQTDSEQKILKVGVVSKELTDTEESSTTGSKIIGEKAKGTVTVFNKTTSIKTFARGTELKNGTKVYTLNEDVTVASASTQETSTGQTVQYGKKDAAITAKDIGADFNLDKDAEFTVGNFSKETYAARNEKALTEGSSREIQAVSKEDQQKLSSSLKKNILAKAEEELKKSIPENEHIVMRGSPKVISEEFSAKVGDEVNKVSLKMTAKAEGYTYKSEDLKPIAKDQLAVLVPDGGVLLEDKVGILSKESETASGSAQLSLDATLSSEYVPPTNSDAWLEEIKGKTLDQAKRILSEKPEIGSVDIKLYPIFAQTLVDRLPEDKKKITLNKKVPE